MKKRIGAIIFASVLGISLLMGYRQYRIEPVSGYEDSDTDITSKLDEATDNEPIYDISRAYYKEYDDSGLETYIIANFFGEVDDSIEDIREAEFCEYIFENEDGKIEAKMTEEQRQAWITTAVGNIEDVIDSIEEEDKYEFKLTEDYTELYCNLHRRSDGYACAGDFVVLLYNAEIYQILNGSDDWSVHVIVENMETGEELVNVQYPQEGFEITPEMWD